MSTPTKNAFIYENLIRDHVKGYDSVDPEDLNIERLVEKRIAAVGNLNWVGDENKPWDYACDKSDAKTTTPWITIAKNGKYAYTRYKGEITSVGAKIGALRVVLYNPFIPKLEYFFIPNKDVEKLKYAEGGKRTGSYKICFNWNPKKDSYNKLDPFRCSSFEEICKKRENKC